VIARDAGFADVVYSGSHDAPGFEHGNLPAGSYHWRVLARRGPLESEAGPARRVAVERDRVAPRLEVDLPRGRITTDRLTVRGAVEPGSRVVIGDRAVEVGPDGRFVHEHPLQPGYNFLVVQAIDATGNTAFSNHTIVADFDRPEAAP
jgi:hypothetical protein